MTVSCASVSLGCRSWRSVVPQSAFAAVRRGPLWSVAIISHTRLPSTYTCVLLSFSASNSLFLSSNWSFALSSSTRRPCILLFRAISAFDPADDIFLIVYYKSRNYNDLLLAVRKCVSYSHNINSAGQYSADENDTTVNRDSRVATPKVSLYCCRPLSGNS